MARGKKQPKLEFIEETHEYFIDGFKLSHVTGVLEGEGFTDYSRVNPVYLAECADFGNKVHKYLHFYDEGILDMSSLPDEIKPYLEGWKQFCKDYNVIHVIIEQPMASKKYMYAFTADRFSFVENQESHKPEFACVEIKTTSTLITRATRIQTAAYQGGYNDGKKFRDKAIRRYVVQLKDDGSYKCVRYDNPKDWDVWLAALTVNNDKKGV
jgi:hypothetical protein